MDSKIMKISVVLSVFLVSVVSNAQDIVYTRDMEVLASKGDSEAQTQLGFCLWNGLGIDVDAQRAVEWYKKASLQNNPTSQFYLGICYIDGFNEGDELIRDYKEGLTWIRASAKQGNADAIDLINNLTSVGYSAWGQLSEFSFNFGGTPSLDELYNRIDVVKEQADEGNGVALFWLGYILENEGKYTEALNTFDKSKKAFDIGKYTPLFDVEQTDAIEMYVCDRIGWYCQNGIGTPKDYYRAMKAYTSSNQRDAYYPFPDAYLGEVQAAFCARELKQYDRMIKLLESAGVPGALWAGESYFQGIGITKDYKKAFEFFSKVVDSEGPMGMPLKDYYPSYYSDACYRLYQLHREGLGCQKDDDLAKLYFRTAVKYGSTSALYDDQKNYEQMQSK